MFVGIRTPIDYFARVGLRDAGQCEQIAFARGVQVDRRAPTLLPPVAGTLSSSTCLASRFMRGVVDLASCFLNGGFSVLGGLGNFVASPFLARALILRVGTATDGCEQQYPDTWR